MRIIFSLGNTGNKQDHHLPKILTKIEPTALGFEEAGEVQGQQFLSLHVELSLSLSERLNG